MSYIYVTVNYLFMRSFRIYAHHTIKVYTILQYLRSIRLNRVAGLHFSANAALLEIVLFRQYSILQNALVTEIEYLT